MNLVLLTPQLPFPPHQGTTIRNYNLVRNLSPHHNITLISFASPDELEAAPDLRRMCRRIAIAPHPKRTILQRTTAMVGSRLPDMGLRLESSEMRGIANAELEKADYDLVQVEGIEMAGYVLNRDQPQCAQVVFDDHNAEYVLQRSAFEADSRNPERWHAAVYSLVQWMKLVRYEREICRRAQHILAASQADAEAIRQLGSSTPISIVPNGVDTDHFVPSTDVCAKPLAELSMVFTGKMDFRPNIDAMVWFCNDILPRVRAAIPLAHIVIVGQQPAPAVRALSSRDGVQVTGWVADTRPFVSDSALYVVPLRMGSGTRLKVLEAMAMGKAIVSTSRGVEGIDVVDGRDVVIADSAQQFALAARALLRDPERRRSLGASARLFVESKYDWKSIVPRLEPIYSSLVHH